MTQVIGTRIFSQIDIDWFAAASGDHNPLHVDPEIARRLIAGGTVTHGVYAFLWALEEYFKTGGQPLDALNARFRRTISAGEEIRLTRRDAPKSISISLESAVEEVASIVLSGNLITEANSAEMRRGRPSRGQPSMRTFGELGGLSGEVPITADPSDLRREFPSVVAALGELPTAAIMALSPVVGMKAPGLHSIFTGIDIALAGDNASGSLQWRVSRVISPIAPIKLEVEGGGLRGHLDAVIRPAPVSQPGMREVEAAVSRDEFVGHRAIIVGGSRGLGELVAKLVAAGGGVSAITYFKGEADAKRVAFEIEARGGSCKTLPLDVGNSNSVETAIKSDASTSATHLYYFATPLIAKLGTDVFDVAAFNRYSDTYVGAFVNFTTQLHRSAARPLHVLYPSSTYVAEPPKGFAEYVAAKGAGEAACNYLSRTRADLDIVVHRLPRLETDQTASLIPKHLGSSLVEMTSVVRAMHARL
ncbi:MAG: SDR family NAD(P)-dependent oxidoreductase [Devosia sp.]